MRLSRTFTALVAMTGLLLTAPNGLRAAEPEALPQKVFEVTVAGGVVEVSFALALNEVSTYPLTVTAVGGSVEEVLWDGTLAEGFYRLRAPLKKITSGPLKVVLRTKLTNRDARGAQTFLRYLTWEGTVN